MEKQIMWAVYGPDGIEIQTLSTSENNSITLKLQESNWLSWEDYQKMGYACKQVEVTIKPKQ